MLKQYGKQVNRKEIEDSYDAASIRGNIFGEDSDRQMFNQSAMFMDTPRTPPIEFEMFRMSNTSLELVSNSTESLFVRFLKDVYIGEEDDNPRRKQARYVLRSITFLSFAIGIAFTALWYIAPGKFISYRGDRDFSEKYSSEYWVSNVDMLGNNDSSERDISIMDGELNSPLSFSAEFILLLLLLRRFTKDWLFNSE